MKLCKTILAVFQNDKIQPFILIWICFFFPAIALLNFFTGTENSVFSYIYRCISLLMAALLVTIRANEHPAFQISTLFKTDFQRTFKNSLQPIALWLLLIFWLFYLCRIISDVSVYKIYLEGKSSLSYYLMFATGVTLLPSISSPVLRIKDFQLLNHLLSRFLQLISLTLLVLYFVIVFTADKPVFRYILMRGDFEFLDAISISVIGGLLILVTLLKQSLNRLFYLWILIGSYLMAAAASRGPYISLLIAMSFLIFKNKKHVKPVLIALGIISFSTLLHWIFTLVLKEIFIFGNPLADRWLNFEKDQSSINRILLLKEGVAQFINHPVTGSHFIVVSLGLYVHNFFLDVLLSTGITGLVLITPAFLLFFKRIFSDTKPLFVFTIAIFFLFNAMTSGAVYNLNEFWFLFMYATFGNFKSWGEQSA